MLGRGVGDGDGGAGGAVQRQGQWKHSCVHLCDWGCSRRSRHEQTLWWEMFMVSILAPHSLLPFLELRALPGHCSPLNGWWLTPHSSQLRQSQSTGPVQFGCLRSPQCPWGMMCCCFIPDLGVHMLRVRDNCPPASTNRRLALVEDFACIFGSSVGLSPSWGHKTVPADGCREGRGNSGEMASNDMGQVPWSGRSI